MKHRAALPMVLMGGLFAIRDASKICETFILARHPLVGSREVTDLLPQRHDLFFGDVRFHLGVTTGGRSRALDNV